MGIELFGADWPLVKDALVIAKLAIGGGLGLGALAFRKRGREKSADSTFAQPRDPKLQLEERVRVLERIATDRSDDLAEEIESLRHSSRGTN